MGVIVKPPTRAYSLWDTVTESLVTAGAQVAWDFIAGDPQPWAYYPGVAAGVLANSKPGLGAAIWVVGTALDVVFRKGPDASDIKVFVDGVLTNDLSAQAAAIVWETLHIGDLLEGAVHVIELVNAVSASDPTNAGIMALGQATVTGETPRSAPLEAEFQGVWHLTFTVEDAKSASSTHSVYLPAASYSHDAAVYFAQDYANRLSPLLAGVIRRVSVRRDIPAPGAGSIPQPFADVEEGLRVDYDLVNGFRFSHTLATWADAYLIPFDEDQTRMPSGDPAVTDFLDLMSEAETFGYPGNPCDRRGVPIYRLWDVYQTFKKSRSEA